MTNGEFGVATVTVIGEVWGLEAISQEEGITPFLRSPVLLIECVLRINEEKTPVLFLRVLLPEYAQGMYAALYPRIHSPGQLLRPAGSLCLLPYQPKQLLCHHPSTSSPYPDRSDSWLLVQYNQPAARHGAICGPWGPPIAQPLFEVANNQPQFRNCRPKL